jgi:TPR repeat protein
MYNNGEYVEKNDDLAMEWLIKAYEQDEEKCA